MTDSAPRSTHDWFVWAIPSDEALDIAEAYENDEDVDLRKWGQAAREYYNDFVESGEW